MKDADQGKQAPEVKPQGASRRRSHVRNWFILAVLALVLPLSLRWWLSSYASFVPGKSFPVPMLVYIPAGTGFAGIKQTLVEHEVIRDDPRFYLLAKSMGVVGKMQAGEYLFPPALSHREIIEKLAKGDVYYRPLTIPEGFNIFQVGNLLAADFGFDVNLFLRQVRDRKFIKTLGLEAPSLEGYLYPDTYFVTRGQGLEAVISMMVQRFQRVAAEIVKQYQPDTSREIQSLSLHEIVILASIVEKETAVAEERPLVAAVYLNRLKKNMRLQADPTVIYGIPGFSGNLTRQDLLTPSPYNTYEKNGLPAGPIANPGRESLAAAVHPADVDYLYFVAKNDGTHHFSTSLPEHNRAVSRFQKQGNVPGNESALGKSQ